MTEIWYKPNLSYKPTHKMGRACRTWCEHLGLKPTFNGPDWKTVASIIRNFDLTNYTDNWLIISRDQHLNSYEELAGINHTAKIKLLDYLVKNGIIQERIGFTGVTSTYKIVDPVLWNLEKGVILSDSFTEVNTLHGKSIIKNKLVGEKKTLGIRFDKNNSSRLKKINNYLENAIVDIQLDPMGFNWSKLDSLKNNKPKEYTAVVDSLSLWLSRSSLQVSLDPWDSHINTTPPQSNNSASNSLFNDIFDKIIGGIFLQLTTCYLFQVQIARREIDNWSRERWVNKGGRLYHDCQGLASVFRCGLKINGNYIKELDISGSHIYQAYASKGISQVPTYSVDIFNHQQNIDFRKHIKIMILTAINASSESAAIGAVQLQINKGELAPLPQGISVSDLFCAAKRQFSEINDLMCSDKGVDFMGAEGELCFVVSEWAMENKKIILTIHDGFLCFEKDITELENFIQTWCTNRFGYPPILEQKL